MVWKPFSRYQTAVFPVPGSGWPVPAKASSIAPSRRGRSPSPIVMSPSCFSHGGSAE